MVLIAVVVKFAPLALMLMALANVLVFARPPMAMDEPPVALAELPTTVEDAPPLMEPAPMATAVAPAQFADNPIAIELVPEQAEVLPIATLPPAAAVEVASRPIATVLTVLELVPEPRATDATPAAVEALPIAMAEAPLVPVAPASLRAGVVVVMSPAMSWPVHVVEVPGTVEATFVTEGVMLVVVVVSVMPAPAVRPFTASDGPVPLLTRVSVPPALVSVTAAADAAIVISVPLSVSVTPAPAVRPFRAPGVAAGRATVPPALVRPVRGVNEQSLRPICPVVSARLGVVLTGRLGARDVTLNEARDAANVPFWSDERSDPPPSTRKCEDIGADYIHPREK
jgi:hypothetical protein